MIGCAAATGLSRSDQHVRPASFVSMTDRDKDIEILALRLQISVLQRQVGGIRVWFTRATGRYLPRSCTDYRSRSLQRLRLLARMDTPPRWHRELAGAAPRCGVPSQTPGTASHRPVYSRPRRTADQEPYWGLPPNPWRASRPRGEGRGIDGA